MQVTKLVRLLNDRVDQYPPRMLSWELGGNHSYLLITLHWAQWYHNQAAISLTAIDSDDSDGMLTAFIDHMIAELRFQQMTEHHKRIEEDFRAYFPPTFPTSEGQH